MQNVKTNEKYLLKMLIYERITMRYKETCVTKSQEMCFSALLRIDKKRMDWAKGGGEEVDVCIREKRALWPRRQSEAGQSRSHIPSSVSAK